MHRSALGALSIDVPSDRLDATSAFWRAALVRSTRVGTTYPEYQLVDGRVGSLYAQLQDVGDDHPHVHLDLYTDDVEAEVARLTGLGAREVARHGEWVVLEDPAGLAFCVCPVAAADPVLEGAPVHPNPADAP